MIQIKDQLGFDITFNPSAQRIVSLVPSLTSLCCDLGLGNGIIGKTRYCPNDPRLSKECKEIGGTKKFDIQAILELRPDLIIANKEENPKDAIVELKEYFNVYISEIKNLSDNQRTISDISKITDSQNLGNRINDRIQQEMKFYQNLNSNNSKYRVCYLIWKNPIMSVGGDTFIHSLIEAAGWINVCSDMLRYPALTLEEIAQKDPDILLLSDEPYPFASKDQAYFPFPSVLVDAKAFSWYGSKIISSFDYFFSLRNQIKESL